MEKFFNFCTLMCPKKYLEVLLLGGGVLSAMVLCNLGGEIIYQDWIHWMPWGMDLTVLEFINEGLMALFFLDVALEIKQELLSDPLSTWKKGALPILAALGGVIVPALLYRLCNATSIEHLKGWAIPTTTDIAFALGVLSLFSRTIPVNLKFFIGTLAIIDDLIAILIIMTVYTKDFIVIWIGASALVTSLLWGVTFYKLYSLSLYAVLGILLWMTTLKAGIHATFSGVILAVVLPVINDSEYSLSHRLKNSLHTWVNYFVLPVFAFCNGGLNLNHFSIGTIIDHPVFVGIVFGLFFGKFLGIFLATWLTVKLSAIDLPPQLHWSHVAGAASLGGIGFTMSLFISHLAFSEKILLDIAKYAVFVGSLLSASSACLLFYYLKPARH